MSRGAMAALSSVLAAACSSDPGATTGQPVVNDDASDTTQPSDDTATTEASNADTASTDTAKANDTSDAAEVHDTSACEGATNAWSACAYPKDTFDFKCGATHCSCFIASGASYPAGAPWTCYDDSHADVTATCDTCVTCECFDPPPTASCRCGTTADGCTFTGLYCWGCYGAPPARTRALAVS